MYSNIFYFDSLNKIGGTETFLYYLAKKYKKYDITVIIKNGDPKQVNRLKKYVRVKYYDGKIIECKKAFFNYRPSIIDNIKAEEYIQIVHANYKAQKKPAPVNEKINKYIGVSKDVCNAFYELSNKNIELCYNPVCIDNPEKVLMLVSATRLTQEKGLNEMQRLAEILDKKQIKYLWLIFTNKLDEVKKWNNPNIVPVEPKLDIISYIKKCDFLVQLSYEAYGYSIVESLLVGTPVIVLDIPVFDELKIDKTNSIKLNPNFEDIDENLLFKEYKFNYVPLRDNWEKLLVLSECTYKEENMKVKVRCIVNYFDIEEQERKVTNEEVPYDNPEKHPNRCEWITTKERADHLVSKGKVKIIEEIKEEPEKAIIKVDNIIKETIKEDKLEKSINKPKTEKKKRK